MFSWKKWKKIIKFYLFLALFGRGDARYCLGSIDDYLHVAHFWGSRKCILEIGELGLAFRQIVSFACALLFFASMRNSSQRNKINSLAFSNDEDFNFFLWTLNYFYYFCFSKIKLIFCYYLNLIFDVKEYRKIKFFTVIPWIRTSHPKSSQYLKRRAFDHVLQQYI